MSMNGQCTKWLRNIAENSIASVGLTNVTDRQTDLRRHYSEREPEFTFAKKVT